MKAPKIKCYRIPVSPTYPKWHPKAGQETYFIPKIRANNILDEMSVIWEPKLHTCRANYEFWKKRMDEVQRGEAVIKLYLWEGKPYRSKQVVILTLDKDSGCGVQKLEFEEMIMTSSPVLVTKYKGLERIFRPTLKLNLSDLAKNDGLSLDDFKAWFKVYDLSKPMAIIQFTSFRY